MSIEPEKLYEKILPSIKADFGHIGVEADLEDATWNIVNILEAVLTPRTITTVEELDALPDASVILFEQGGVWEHQWDDGGRYWVTPGNSDEVFTSDKLALPATVLYEPTV